MTKRWKKQLSERSDRLIGFDLLRALAILLVLVCHGLILLPDFSLKVQLSASTGFFGVALFFVLSGFLIGGILLRLHDSEDGYNITKIKDFWIRRWFRTLPNYLLFLAINAWIRRVDEFHPEFLLFLQNFAWKQPRFFLESWSLAIEEWFYLLFPLFLFLITSIPQKRKTRFLHTAIVWIALFNLARFFHFSTNSDWDEEIRKVVIFQLDAIGYGVVMASLEKIFPTWLERKKHLLAGIGCTLLTFSVFYLWNTNFKSPIDWYMGTIFFSLTGISVALCLPWLKRLKWKKSLFSTSIRWISLISYSLYLCHFSIVIPKILQWTMRWGWNTGFSLLLYFAISISLASLVYLSFERPMTALRDRFSSKE